MSSTALLVFSQKLTTTYWKQVLEEANYSVSEYPAHLADWQVFVRKQQPTFVLIEAAYADDYGLEMARLAREAYPATRCVLFVPRSTAYYLDALQVDASAYLPNDLIDADELRYCLTRIGAGYRYISPVFVEALHLPTLQHKERVEALSKRQKQILLFVAQGHTARQIAVTLGIGESTARNHMYHISQKVGLEGVYQLKSFAGSVRHLLE